MYRFLFTECIKDTGLSRDNNTWWEKHRKPRDSSNFEYMFKM